jgi:hypothetical protein
MHNAFIDVSSAGFLDSTPKLAHRTPVRPSIQQFWHQCPSEEISRIA